MTVLSLEASMLAHGVHYAILGVGLLGLLALLGPQLLGRAVAQAPRDDHDRRVLEVQHQIARGSLGVAIAPAPALPAPPPPVVRFGAGLLPMAVVSSAAAAGAHAAVGPVHFDEQVLFGLFFLGSASAQILWSVAIVLRPSRTLLRAAVVGNTAVLALWVATRTAGLPGLMPQPEAVGPWDLSCAAWELTVVLACAHLLRRHRTGSSTDLQLPPWSRWPRTAQNWALGSVVALAVLSFSGAGS